jgi:tetratricopeptide (TPR) repeat protein
MKAFVTPLSLLVVVLAAALGRAQDDQVFDKSGRPTRGLIRAVSPQQIRIDSTGGSRTFNVRDVVKVTFGDEPAEMRTARDRALAGQYEDAVEELKKINMNEIQNAVLKQDILYYAAFCKARLALTAGGDKEAAAALMSDFIRDNRTTFHLFEGLELLGELNFAMGKYAEAGSFYRYYVSLAEVPERKMKGTVMQARALAAEGKDAEALPLFEQVLSSGLNTPDALEQKMYATVGKAVSLAAAGSADQGVAIIEDLIAKNDPSDMTLFGRAYNALGACYMKTGKTQEALLAYLHTDVLFFADPESHAEALYYLSKLWADANRSDRAVQARSTLQTRYAGSRWAALP